MQYTGATDFAVKACLTSPPLLAGFETSILGPRRIDTLQHQIVDLETLLEGDFP
jgi:hypothetical protein